MLLTPFLPNTCKKLHEILALPGAFDDGPWAMPSLEEGHALGTPSPLFKKLDDSIVEEERADWGRRRNRFELYE